MKLRFNVNVDIFGKILMVLYIFMSYNAKGILFPPTMNSIALFSFLGVAVVHFLHSYRGTGISTYSKWYFILLFLSFVNMLYAPEFSVTTGEFYLMLVSFGVTFAVQMYVRDEKSFRTVMWAYVISAVVLIISLYYTGNLVATRDNRLGEELVGNANVFSTMIMIAAMCCLWLLIYDTDKLIKKIVLLLMFALGVYALILSAGRSSFVVPFVFLYVLLVSKTNKKGRKSVIKYTILIGIILLIVWQLIMKVPIFYDNIGYRMESYYNGIRGLSSQGTSAQIRSVLRKEAFLKGFESPVWGHGFDSFRYYARTFVGVSYYSHCNFTELWYNGGIILLVSYYWIHIKIVKECLVENRGIAKFRSFALALMVSMLVIDFTGVTYLATLEQVMILLALSGIRFVQPSSMLDENERSAL